MEPFFVIYLPMIASMIANHFILILSINLNIGHSSLRCNTLVTLRDIHGVSNFLGKTICARYQYLAVYTYVEVYGASSISLHSYPSSSSQNPFDIHHFKQQRTFSSFPFFCPLSYHGPPLSYCLIGYYHPVRIDKKKQQRTVTGVV
jgi:hypothetical protein